MPALHRKPFVDHGNRPLLLPKKGTKNRNSPAKGTKKPLLPGEWAAQFAEILVAKGVVAPVGYKKTLP